MKDDYSGMIGIMEISFLTRAVSLVERNSKMKKYCDLYLIYPHIWTSVHNSKTIGKLFNFQKKTEEVLKKQAEK
jgi:hypothetical protein